MWCLHGVLREGSVQFAQTRRPRRGRLAQRSPRSFRDARCVARAWRRVAQRSVCVCVCVWVCLEKTDLSLRNYIHTHWGKGVLKEAEAEDSARRCSGKILKVPDESFSTSSLLTSTKPNPSLLEGKTRLSVYRMCRRIDLIAADLCGMCVCTCVRLIPAKR